VALCLLLAPRAARAQNVALDVFPGSTSEAYLRALQVSGAVPLHPWSIRGFSQAETDRLLPDSAHPWSARTRPAGNGVHLLSPRADLVYNSAFPYGANDGVVWAGRGVTASGSLGVSARWRALSVRLQPEVFWAQNAEFTLMRASGPQPLADPDNPANIDLPQRFGTGAYRRVDPGQSTIRLDVLGLAAGVSTAGQAWGPAADQPLILGANAPGYAHAFLGTSSPWKAGIGRVHGRLVWGSLRQSDWSPADPDSARRFMAGAVGVFTPRGVDGLEIGFSRFFHIPYGDDGVGVHDFLRPLETFFKAHLGKTGQGPDNRSDAENQLASVFARWVFPRAGLEVYGEYGREDHNWDLLDSFLEPDHTASYVLGGSRAWRRGGTLYSARAELLNSQASHLQTARNQGRWYRHFAERQGHTHRGQLLGSPAAYGGGGSVVAVDAFTPRGGWSVDWTRTRVRDNWGLGAAAVPDPDPRTDVLHSLGGEALVFGRGMDAVFQVRTTWELNRHLEDDAFNLTAGAGLRLHF
jgi:hypothetical protein